MKAAAEFGVVAKGQTIVGTVVFLSDVHAIGLPIAQGLTFTQIGRRLGISRQGAAQLLKPLPGKR